MKAMSTYFGYFSPIYYYMLFSFLSADKLLLLFSHYGRRPYYAEPRGDNTLIAMNTYATAEIFRVEGAFRFFFIADMLVAIVSTSWPTLTLLLDNDTSSAMPFRRYIVSRAIFYAARAQYWFIPECQPRVNIFSLMSALAGDY